MTFRCFFSLNKTEGKTKGLSPSLSAHTFHFSRRRQFYEKTKRHSAANQRRQRSNGKNSAQY
ncbi:hypothetical protein FPV32_01770 [Bacillus tequilensis]|nr:hypothetical protein [Bacillus tequilensis]